MPDGLITDVIYEKGTHRVILVKYNDLWVIPENFNLAHFANGVEPVFVEKENGNVYIKPNAIIVNDIR